MSDILANGVDWWVNLLNKRHILPTNMATLIRDISAKQLGSKSFTPRPLTAANFTDPELYAILQGTKTDTGYTHLTDDRYDIGHGQHGAGFNYGAQGLTLGEYLSPRRSVSTTLGNAAVRRDSSGKHVLYDTYDFNVGDKKLIVDSANNRFIGSDGIQRPMSELDEYMRADAGRANTSYGRLRNNAARLGHTSRDPDNTKIKTHIVLEDIDRRLRGKWFNTDAPVSKGSFVKNMVLAGGLTGAPLGALLGVSAGALSLTSAARRKRWGRILATYGLIGAGLGGVLGSVAGGASGAALFNRFEKKGSAGQPVVQPGSQRRKKRRSLLASALPAIVPTAVLGAGALYAGLKAKRLATGMYDTLFSDVDWRNETRVVPTDNIEEVMSPAW